MPKPTRPSEEQKVTPLSRDEGGTHEPLALLKEPPNTALQAPDATFPPVLSDVRAPPPPTNESYPLAVFLKPPPTVDNLSPQTHAHT